MAQNSWPSPDYNSRAVTDSEYEQLAARFSDDGIDGRPSDPAVVTAGPGLSVNVRADVYGNVRGRAWYSGSTTVNIPIGANASGSTRTDRIVLRLDRSDWTVRAAVKAGSPGAGAPVLSQTLGDTGVYEVPLARVTVLAGAAAVSVTREELFIGARIRPCTSSTRNPMPKFAELGAELDTGRVIMWDGSAWRVLYSYTDNLVVNSTVSGWRNEVDSVLEEKNGVVTLRLGSFERTGGTLSGTTSARLPALIPSAYRHPSRDQYATAYVTGGGVARVTVYSKPHERSGQLWLVQKPAISKGDYVLTANMTWVVG